jgi:hypothetical protein
MAKTQGRKILYRVNYRKEGKTYLGYWTEDRKAMLSHKSSLSLLHGAANTNVEMVDKRTGRPFVEDRDDDGNEESY